MTIQAKLGGKMADPMLDHQKNVIVDSVTDAEARNGISEGRFPATGHQASEKRGIYGYEHERLLRGRHCFCAECGAYFNSDHPFAMHRIGPMRDRRCMTEAEMLAKGMALNAGDWWVSELRS